MVALLLAFGLPSPSPSPTPLKTIITIEARQLCSTLRERLVPAMAGVSANDQLVTQGQRIFNRWASDASEEPSEAYGGAGAASSLDDVRVENVVDGLASNIAKIDALLDRSPSGDSNSKDGAALAAARTRLLDVLTQQKAELNVLSAAAYTNQQRDLQARRNPLGRLFDPPASQLGDSTPVTLPEQLSSARANVQNDEHDAAAALAPIIASCR